MDNSEEMKRCRYLAYCAKFGGEPDADYTHKPYLDWIEEGESAFPLGQKQLHELTALFVKARQEAVFAEQDRIVTAIGTVTFHQFGSAGSGMMKKHVLRLVKENRDADEEENGQVPES